MHTSRSRRRTHTGARPAPCVPRRADDRYLIVNADDLGADRGTSRGIIEAHARGIVTSASLMVDMPDTRAAVRAAREHPRLGVGLHVSFTAGPRTVDLADARAVRQELERQLDRFVELTGQAPTHIDSHHHVHRRPELAPLFVALSRSRRIPLRGFSGVTYLGHFYGQWEHGKTDLSHISPEYLMSLLQGIRAGVSELACHPGDRDARFDPMYDWQRRFELDALTDPRVTTTARRSVRLISYRDLGRALGREAGPRRPAAVERDAPYSPA